jgi:chorismate mutase
MNKAEEMKALAPEIFREIKEYIEIFNVQGEEINRVYGAIAEALDQCFVSTATRALERWEKMLAIPVDNAKETAYRRDVILSKIKGGGTVTPALIKTVAESYNNGEVDVIEHPETYSFEVKFIGTRGIPPNLSDLQNAIHELKPAHLAVTYTFTYTTWGEVKQTTWAVVKTGTWEDLKTRRVI